jgi:hypothetical protein
MKKMLLSLAVMCAALACCKTGLAQDTAAVQRGQAVPRSYQTYSLFLVCNPQWLDQDKRGDLHNLYIQFKNFGRAIGDDHVAVWFWKAEGRTLDDDGNLGQLAQDVDVERSERFCHAWKLKPSEGPHVVVTSTYPKESDLSAGPPKDIAVYSLGNMVPKDISALLAKLTDDLVQTGHVTQPAAAGLWVRLLEATQQTINSFGCAWTFKIEAGPVNANLKSCKT